MKIKLTTLMFILFGILGAVVSIFLLRLENPNWLRFGATEEPHITGWYTEARANEETPHPAITADEEDPVGEEDPTPDMTWEYVPVSPGNSYTTNIMGVTVVFTVDKECRALSAGNKLELEVR